MNTATTNSLRVAQTIRANQARLFRAWTEPKELMHWWHMDAQGSEFVDASVDLRVGGKYRLAMTTPDGKVHVAIGEYREVDPPTRLAFTWDWDDPAASVGETLVTIDFNDVGNNMTEVVLTHERFAKAEQVSGHEHGWTQLLRLLDRMATGDAA